MTAELNIAKPYARAAFDFAREQDTLADWEQQLQLLTMIVQDERMVVHLDNPGLSWQQRAEIILAIAAEQLTEPVQRFLRLLAENQRLMLLPMILAEFAEYRRVWSETIEAEVIAAHPVTAAELQKIKSALARKFDKIVNLRARVDERLLGGAIIKVNDWVIDGSVRNQLAQLSTNLHQ